MKKDQEKGKLSNTSIMMKGTLHKAIQERVARTGNTLYVDATYHGDEKGSQQKPYRTISEALNRAIADNTVIVAPGIYHENIRLREKVRVVSQITGAAIIHGGASRYEGRPTISGVNDAELIGFTILGGYGGVVCDGTSPQIKHNIIRGNYGDYALTCLNGSRAIIQNNTIIANFGNEFDGLSVGIYVENAEPVVCNNIISGNNIGYVAYQCVPFERFNNVWGNRRNFGHATQPDRRSIAVDPNFVDPSLGNYQLEKGSLCHQAGRNPEDNSFMNMGAFDAHNEHVTKMAWLDLPPVAKDAFNAFPYITFIERRGHPDQPWRSALDEQLGHFWARPGDEITVKGVRLISDKYSQQWTTLRSGESGTPLIHFGNVHQVFKIDQQNTDSPQDLLKTELKTQVPCNVISGWIFVQVQGLESNPLYLEIRRP